MEFDAVEKGRCEVGVPMRSIGIKRGSIVKDRHQGYYRKHTATWTHNTANFRNVTDDISVMKYPIEY